jgi:hypothetical protein
LTGAIAAAAAGERAADRWLREAGLWTEERAWVIERHAGHDRVYALKALHDAGERLTFGERPGHPHDYATAQAAADRLLDELWQGVYRLADSLTQHRRLSGADACCILRAVPGDD